MPISCESGALISVSRTVWSWEPVATGCMYGEGCWRLDTRGLQIQASLTTSHLGPQLLYVYLCAVLTGEKSLTGLW